MRMYVVPQVGLVYSETMSPRSKGKVGYSTFQTIWEAHELRDDIPDSGIVKWILPNGVKCQATVNPDILGKFLIELDEKMRQWSEES